MDAATTQPVLVYDRIDQNRFKTIFLVIVAVLLLVPFVGGISYGVYEIAANQFDAHHRQLRFLEENKERIEHAQAEFRKMPPEIQEQLREKHPTLFGVDVIKKAREAVERDEREAAISKYSIMGGVAVSLMIILGLLFWNISADPVAKVLAMTGAQPVGEGDLDAKRLLDNLAIGAGLPPPKLYIIHWLAPNAFAVGLSPEHSAIAVTRGLLMLLDHRELEGVLAHELSHIGNHDTGLDTMLVAITLFLRLPYLMWKSSVRRSYGQRTFRSSNRWITTALLPIYIYVLFVAPVLALLLRSAISRSREFLADADAVLLTRFPEGLLRALAKIAGTGTAVEAANPLSSHLYFANPLRPGVGINKFWNRFLATHPPIEERITSLVQFGARVPRSTIEQAVQAGIAFVAEHPAWELSMSVGLGARDELSALQSASSRAGRVCRVIGTTEPVKVRERDDVHSAACAELAPGALVVALDTPSHMRQVITASDRFGYIPRKVKLQAMDMLPAEISDPKVRAAAESQPLPKVEPESQLTNTQIALGVVIGFAVFIGLAIALIKLIK